MKQRRITVNRIFSTRRRKKETAFAINPDTYNPYIEIEVPWLQMKGKWLAEAGFTIGASVNIEVLQGSLVLTIEEPDNQKK